MPKWSRRDLIKGLGLSAAAVGLPSILSSRARAGDGPCPLRFVIFYEKHGYAPRFARPRAPGQGDWMEGAAAMPTETEWELPPAWAPLAGYESRMINFEGMDMRSATLPSATADGGGHGHLQSNALTAAPRIEHNRPGGASIDQHIADGLAANGVVSRVHSINVTVGTGNPNGSGTYRPDGTEVPSLIQPPIIYDRLFPEELQASAEEQAAAARRRTASANLVQSLSSGLISRLPQQQRLRVEAHMQLHTDLQARLGLRVAGAIPDRASTLGVWSEPLMWVNDPGLASIGLDRQRAYELTRDVNIRMVAAALHADITRVAVIGSEWLPDATWDFESGDAETGRTGTFGVLGNHGFHHEVVDEAALGMMGDDYMIRYHQRTSDALRHLLDTLAALPEADGSSLLDNTVILHATEMANPAHRWQMVHWQVIGDAQGQFRTGRTMLFDRVQDEGNERERVVTPAEWGSQPRGTVIYHQHGPTHGQLLASLANAMGVETPTFGDASICPGPLDLS